jgi:hypothetical protein
MAPINWSANDLHKMPEGEWRTYLSMRLDSLEDSVSGIPSRLSVIERRCALRRWQGRVLWAALAATVGLWIERLWPRT